MRELKVGDWVRILPTNSIITQFEHKVFEPIGSMGFVKEIVGDISLSNHIYKISVPRFPYLLVLFRDELMYCHS